MELIVLKDQVQRNKVHKTFLLAREYSQRVNLEQAERVSEHPLVSASSCKITKNVTSVNYGQVSSKQGDLYLTPEHTNYISQCVSLTAKHPIVIRVTE